MIPASLYHNIYLFLVTILTLVAFRKYIYKDDLYEDESSNTELYTILLISSIVLFIGLRPASIPNCWKYFGDTQNYVQIYEVFYEGANFTFDRNTDSIIFDNLFAWWGSAQLGYTSFFLFLSIIYFTTSYLGIRKLFPNDKLAVYLVFLAAFSTYSYSVNGIKAGAASSLFLWAIAYRDNLKICIPLILISWGFHHSMIMPVAAFVTTIFFKNPKIYFGFWAFCLLMAIAHVTAFAHFFAGATTEHGASYLLGDGTNDGTKGGFRLDFIIYSAMPVLVGWYAVVKKQLELSDTYINLLNLYLCLNGVWMLCMYANFTNRIAYLSWFLYPIVLIYPFLNEDWGEDRYQKFGYVMLAHLGFTLFMNYIY